MKKETKTPLHHRLFFKIYLSYACVLTLSAVLIGILFMMLYIKTTMKSYYRQLERQAVSISNKLSEFILDDEYDGSLDYIKMIIDLDDRDIWLLSKEDAEHPLSEYMPTMSFKGTVLQSEYRRMIERLMKGKRVQDTFEDNIHGDLRNVVGVPITGMNGKLVGALIYSAPADAQKQVINTSVGLIIECIVASFLISIVIANLFVRNITKPILKMHDTAGELAKGMYTTRTNIDRKDEIGQLACTVDVLAERLMQNEEERKNLDQMRLDFFANVSHELRTPITVIRAYTETLYDRVVTDEDKVQQYYERMLHECTSMQRLVGDLLVLSKMQNPDFEVEKEPVNIIQVFEDIIRSLGTISKEKNIRLVMDTDLDVVLVFGDYDRLRQMFIIIMDNAIKFSNNDSEIRIKIERTDKLTISIQDYGVGISKEELPYIFDKFYKSKLRQNAKGSGLGLAIAKQIAIKHNGTITVESEVNVGTKFSFFFDYLTEEDLRNL